MSGEKIVFTGYMHKYLKLKGLIYRNSGGNKTVTVLTKGKKSDWSSPDLWPPTKVRITLEVVDE
jgi:hypothetical protein